MLFLVVVVVLILGVVGFRGETWLVRVLALVVVGLAMHISRIWLVESAVVTLVLLLFKVLIPVLITFCSVVVLWVLLIALIVGFVCVQATFLVVPFSVALKVRLKPVLLLLNVHPLIPWSWLKICLAPVGLRLLFCVVNFSTNRVYLC